MKDSALYYSVGALLYCPANNESISDSIILNKFVKPFSLALCLEDTILTIWYLKLSKYVIIVF